jgi:hypothetical protein
MTEQGQSSRLMSEWIEHRREHDDELLGFLVPDGEWFTPVTVFGYPIAEPTDRDDAEESLDRIGLSYLAERWNLKRERQAPIQVEIVEASPQRVVVKNVDFGSELDYGTRFTLSAPVDGRLTLS